MSNNKDYEVFCSRFMDIVRSRQHTIGKKIKKFFMSVYSKLFGVEKSLRRFITDEAFEDYVGSLALDYDVVCVPFENSMFRSILANSGCKRKVQWIQTDYAVWRDLNDATRNVTKNDRSIYEKFDRIVFVSCQARDGFIRVFPEFAGKCAACDNLVDVEYIRRLSNEDYGDESYFSPREEDALRIISMARLIDEEKAIKRSLDAARMLRDAGYRFEWLFLGDGDDRDILYRYAQSLGLDDCVFWGGQQENPYKFIRNADVNALFSYYEGVPTSLYEALILGVPVIATNVGKVEDIVPDVGWMVENDINSIYIGLSNLLEHRELVEQAKRNLTAYVYDNTRIGKEIEAIFNHEGSYGN